MAGHLGAARRTVLNLEIVRIDADRQLLMVKGAVPGSRGRDIVVKPTSRPPRPAAPATKPAAAKAAPPAAPKAAPAPKTAPAPAEKASK
jgi:large subunit ribosomal protein L3